jgi:hypothetical protein
VDSGDALPMAYVVLGHRTAPSIDLHEPWIASHTEHIC